MSEATGRAAFHNLAMIFKNRARRPDIWNAITQNLEVFARTADVEATRARASKAAPSERGRRRGIG